MVGKGNETGSLTALVLAPTSLGAHLPRDAFQTYNFQVLYAETLKDARDIADQQPIATLFAPLQIGPDTTLSFIGDLLKNDPGLPVVVVSQNDQIDSAAEAMRLGAFDCIFLPFTKARLEKTVGNVAARLAKQGGADRIGKTGKPTAPPPAPDTGQAPSASWTPGTQTAPRAVLSDLPVQPLLRALNAVSSGQAPVFIQGEPGTGKHALARAIHAESHHATDPFLVLDCAMLNATTLAEQLLSDAHRIVDSATFLFENIAKGEMNIQAQLLRFLDTRDIRTLGGQRRVKLKIRVICTSTTDPQDDIAAGRLNEKLFQRLSAVPIHLPPLRDRPQDILAIAQAKLRQVSEQQKRSFRGFTDDARAALSAHSWPGNIRQLAQIIEQIVLTNDAKRVSDQMLPQEFLQDENSPITPSRYDQDLSRSGLLGRSLAEVERIVIEETIRAQKGSLPKAARVLGVSPSTLYRKREGWKKRL